MIAQLVEEILNQIPKTTTNKVAMKCTQAFFCVRKT